MADVKEPKNNNEEPEENEESVDYLMKRAERILNMEPKNMKYPGRKKDSN